MSTLWKPDRSVERLLSDPLDPEYESWRACRYRYVQDPRSGLIYRARTIGGGSFVTGTQTETIYCNPAPGTAKNTFTAEAQVNDTAGMGTQAVLAPYFHQPGYGVGKLLRFTLRGIISSTATPTFTWFVRFVSTAGPLVGGTAALTTNTGIANQAWEMEFDSEMRTMGAAGGNNSTLASIGLASSPGLNPALAQVFGGAASPGTVTMDVGATNLVFLDASCSASSASNGITVLHIVIQGMN